MSEHAHHVNSVKTGKQGPPFAASTLSVQELYVLAIDGKRQISQVHQDLHCGTKGGENQLLFGRDSNLSHPPTVERCRKHVSAAFPRHPSRIDLDSTCYGSGSNLTQMAQDPFFALLETRFQYSISYKPKKSQVNTSRLFELSSGYSVTLIQRLGTQRRWSRTLGHPEAQIRYEEHQHPISWLSFFSWLLGPATGRTISPFRLRRRHSETGRFLASMSGVRPKWSAWLRLAPRSASR